MALSCSCSFQYAFAYTTSTPTDSNFMVRKVISGYEEASLSNHCNNTAYSAVRSINHLVCAIIPIDPFRQSFPSRCLRALLSHYLRSLINFQVVMDYIMFSIFFFVDMLPTERKYRKRSASNDIGINIELNAEDVRCCFLSSFSPK